MRLIEFDQTPSAVDSGANMEGVFNLLTILNVLIGRANNENTKPSVSTNALINMVKNTGVLFDYNALIDAYETNAGVKKLIKNFSKETVDLVGSADEIEAPEDAGENSGEAIAKIAKRVANRNIG